MPTAAHRYDALDSSVAYQTAYSTFGHDEEGVAPMLKSGAGPLGAWGPGDLRGLWLFSKMEQRQIVDEMERNPTFAPEIEWMLKQPHAKALIDHSVASAVLNEMEPRTNMASVGKWVTLRVRMRQLVRYVPQAIDEALAAMPLMKKIAVIDAMNKGARLEARPMGDVPEEGLGFWDALVSSIAGAASSIYGAKITSSAQKDIAKIQATTAMQSAEAQMTMAKAAAAIEQAKVQQAAIASGATPAEAGVTMPPGYVPRPSPAGTVGGIPIWAIPVGVGVLGLVLWLVLRR